MQCRQKFHGIRICPIFQAFEIDGSLGCRSGEEQSLCGPQIPQIMDFGIVVESFPAEGVDEFLGDGDMVGRSCLEIDVGFAKTEDDTTESFGEGVVVAEALDDEALESERQIIALESKLFAEGDDFAADGDEFRIDRCPVLQLGAPQLELLFVRRKVGGMGKKGLCFGKEFPFVGKMVAYESIERPGPNFLHTYCIVYTETI